MGNQPVKKFRKNVSAKHQTNWLWGLSSVLETLQIGRWRVYELFVSPEVMDQHTDLFNAKQKGGTELEVVSNAKLAELSQTSDHQGIVARVSKYPYETMESLESGLRSRLETVGRLEIEDGLVPFPFTLSSRSDERQLPLVVLVDRIQEPFQFASILRSCECAGAFAVVMGEYCQAQVTTQVARAAMGVVNQLVIVQTANLVQAANQLKATGLTLVAFDPKAEQEFPNTELKRPICLMIGSETHGLDPMLAALSDCRVRFPAHGKSNTLPTAVAAGILLYEIRRQQQS